jgi:LPXTG-motif cell wall-anchored protein
MNKHSKHAGPSSFGWLRSLLTFRHRNPVARLISVVVAFAIAALLGIGAGAAYADGTDPAPADTSTAAPSSDPTADAPADTPSDPPADSDPAGGSTATSPDASAPDTSTSDGGAAAAGSDTAKGDSATNDTAAGDAATSDATVSSALAKIASGAAPAVVPCGDSDANAVIGDFEVDGDECVNHGAQDWAGIDTSSNKYAATLDKFVDDGDTSGFQGSSKALTDPLTWSKGPAPNDKSDIERVRVYSQKSGVPEDTFSDFAIDRHPDDGGAGGVGTVTYDVEYNQLPDVLSNDGTLTVPHRSPGDLWFVFDQHGNISLDFIAGYKFFATDQGGCKAVAGGGFWCVLPSAPTFGGDTSDDGAFAEGTLDISDAFAQGVCFTFGVVNVRTRTSNTDTTAFKDYIAPLDAVTSNCGSLLITKKDIDTDAAVGGGVYQIIGDPRPDNNQGADYKLCIYDGTAAGLTALEADPDVAALLAADCDEVIADGTADGLITIDPVLAGSYTVTEIVPPPGYLLNPGDGNIDPVTVVDGEPSTAPFANHKQWGPLDISKTAAGSFTATYLWDIGKQIAPTATGPWSDGTTLASPLVKTLGSGSNTLLYYQVVVTEAGVQKTDYEVHGDITVDNPNDDAVTATISDSLTNCVVTAIDGVASGAALPLVDTSVPGGGSTTYSYACDLGDNLEVVPADNTATVTWDKSTYPQSTDDIDADGDFSASDTVADIAYTENSVDKTINVTDDHFDFVPDWVITFGEDSSADDGDGVGVYQSDVYSADAGAVAAGTCSAVITNTATINSGETVLGQTSENGKLCRPAVIPPVVSPPQVTPPTLPNTGGPDSWVLAAGLVLLLGGGTLVAGDRRRRRRS